MFDSKCRPDKSVTGYLLRNASCHPGPANGGSTVTTRVHPLPTDMKPSVSDAQVRLRDRMPRQANGAPYTLLGTTVRTLGDFGIGVGLYFSFLLNLSAVMLVSGAGSFPVILRNAHELRDIAVSPQSGSLNYTSLPHPIVPDGFEPLRGTTAGLEWVDITYDERWDVFTMELCVSTFLLIFIVINTRATSRLEETIDKDHITGRDYSLVVDELPQHIQSADQVRSFYEHLLRPVGQSQDHQRVAVVVLQRHNARLMLHTAEMALARSRLQRITQGREGTRDDLSDIPRVPNVGWVQRFAWYVFLGRSIQYWRWLAHFSNECIRDCTTTQSTSIKRPFRAYVVFDNPADRNEALRRTQRGWCEQWVESRNPLARCPAYVAPEPSDIRWDALHVHWVIKYIAAVISTLCTFFILAFSFWVLFQLQRVRSVYSSSSSSARPDPSTSTVDGVAVEQTHWESFLPGVFIACVNMALPAAIKGLVLGIEFHSTHSSLQTSLLSKLVFTRILNSAVIPFLATPTGIMTNGGVLRRLQSVMFADFLVSNFVRYVDPWTLFVRYVWARYAYTQPDLEDLWEGAQWTLAERYTDAFSTLAFTAFFGPLIPSAYWIAAITFITAYWIDKRLLFVHWIRSPAMDSAIARRTVTFLTYVLIVHLLSSSWVLANWPLREFDVAPNRNTAVDISDKLQWRGNATGNAAIQLYLCIGVVVIATLQHLRRRMWLFLRHIFFGHGEYEAQRSTRTQPAERARAMDNFATLYEPSVWLEDVEGEGNRYFPQGFENEVLRCCDAEP